MILLFPTHIRAQVQRTIPSTCITPDLAKTFKWVGQQPTDPNIVALQQPPATVVVEYDAWASANLTGYVSALLLKQVMGVNVKLMEYPGSRNTYVRNADGTVHVNVEVWPASKFALYNKYVRQDQTVEDLGLLGYFSKISWYINTNIADANPTLIFDSWRSFQQPAVLNFFPAVGTTTRGRNADGSLLCTPDKYSFCNSEGYYVPPQCQGNLRSTCREYWHPDPSYSQGENEQRILSLGLKLVVVYIGLDRFEDIFAQCAQQSAYGCVGYWWKPEQIISAYRFTEVKLNPYTDLCYDKFDPANVNATNELTCDWTIELLHKIGNAKMRQWAPHVSNFFRLLTFREIDMTSMLADYATRGRKAEETACRWITANQAIWRPWIPTPPSNYIRFLDRLNTSEPLSIVVIILCIISYLVGIALIVLLQKYQASPSVKAQSPPFMTVILMGAIIITTSVAMEVAAPSSATCAARTWLLAIGLCTVLSSITLKTWRIFNVFGNRRMRVGNKLSTRRLMTMVGLLLALDAILLAIWTAISSPAEAVTEVSATTFTYSCGVASSDAATVLSILVIIYHAVLLVASVFLSYKIRNVASEFNESKYIGLATYNMTLACIIVIPVVFLPINFRAQFIIKCILILCATIGVMGLLVARPVIEAISAAASGTDPTATNFSGAGFGFGGFKSRGSSQASNKPIVSPTSVTGTINKSAQGIPKGSSVDDMHNGVRFGANFAMRSMSGIIRRWTECNMMLIGGNNPALTIGPVDSKTIEGKFYTALVYAKPLEAADKEKLPGCFFLRIDASTYLVQTTDAAEAEHWVNAITNAFAVVNASHSRGGGSGSASGGTTTVQSGGTRSVGVNSIPGLGTAAQGGGGGKKGGAKA
ncbi:7 transmembrane sweet-taste receptor of 3 GCPR-domain-containing protein [Catenaria anguillulae PL171]|uniref:7 transmembrane sweet-taste receptor of 3 GCPR-domain-containing protein n=1 Tax=Catenaria anguillulae PL171 TaxID=765915 RepID=A0A1Y2HEY3_9FUNG|nr:7 transmembrane sweet-taste receptor of 3 GCPR-domain-containing protein [Catenaria anguillulae PL171]